MTQSHIKIIAAEAVFGRIKLEKSTDLCINESLRVEAGGSDDAGTTRGDRSAL